MKEIRKFESLVEEYSDKVEYLKLKELEMKFESFEKELDHLEDMINNIHYEIQKINKRLDDAIYSGIRN